MKKADLDAAVAAVKAETKVALETVLRELNQGQRKKLAKDDAVRALLNRYGVEVDA